MAFVVIVHLSPDRESSLDEVLQAVSNIPVRQVTGPTQIQANTVYIIPPGKQLEITDGHLTLSEFDAPRWKRAPIDHFFRTLADSSPNGIGVILSGSGADGTVGVKRIKEQGGLLLVQDPHEAEYDAMPRSAISAGVVDFVLPVEQLVQKLVDLRHTVNLGEPADLPESLTETKERVLRKLLSELRSHVDHDFSSYKRPTLLRRIQRRMMVTQTSELEAYLDFLQGHPSEAEALYKDILISVTNFFRDSAAWEDLAEHIIPKLFSDKTPGDEVRAWVVGCATGEEAYSLTMLLLEHAATLEDSPSIKVFASDIDPDALARARRGVYAEAIKADVSQERLSRFFIPHEDGFQVKKEMRDLILFAAHDVLRDPPFSRIDLISCRNLLIYLERNMQEKVFEVFHYGLRAEGYLFLGHSETVQSRTKLFHPSSKKHRIYRKQPLAAEDAPHLPDLPLKTPLRPLQNSAPDDESHEAPNNLSRAALHHLSLEKHAPPSILVDEDHEILHLSSTAGRYLQYPEGAPTHNSIRSVHKELRLHLKNALQRAFHEDAPTSAGPVEIQIDGAPRLVHLIIRPVREEHAETCALVVFAETDLLDASEHRHTGNASDEHTKMLEEELELMQRQLQASIEDHEASEEELKATNAELRSMNEEYQSTLEELETSKEELQAVNEELHTVNAELQSNVDELTRANNDLKNLISSSEVATIFLDHELKIQRFTPQVRRLFNIRTGDEGRPLAHLTRHFADYDNLDADVEHVLNELTPLEREVQDNDQNWYLVRILPYRTVDNYIEGVVVTFVDITSQKRRQNEIRSLASQLVSAEDREQNRIAQILHDDLQQQLFGVQMRLKKLAETADDLDSTDLKTDIEKTNDLLEGAIDKTRTLAVDLSPPVRTAENLADALEWLALRMHDLHDLHVEVASDTDFGAKAPNVRVLLFKVIRELLFNVVKHADVDRARVELEKTRNTLQVRVIDRGKGFDSTEPLHSSGKNTSLGLSSVEERINFLGGRMEIESEPGEGTQVSVIIPVGLFHSDANEKLNVA